MKNFKTLGLIVLSLFIFACTEDDDDGGTTDPNELTTANLAGTYDVVAFEAMAMESDTSGGMLDETTVDITGSEFNNCTFTFTEDGRVTTGGTYTSTAVYTENGMTFTEVEVTDIDLDCTYRISGESLVLSNTDGATVEVRNFSATGLQLFFEQIEVEEDYRYEASGTFTLVKR
jgi:hypothetical protein